MSDKKIKTVTDLQQEYTQLCSKAGHLNYSIHALTAELEAVYSALRAINVEASNLQSAQKDEVKTNE